jgi:hypothetical protein
MSAAVIQIWLDYQGWWIPPIFMKNPALILGRIKAGKPVFRSKVKRFRQVPVPGFLIHNNYCILCFNASQSLD